MRRKKYIKKSKFVSVFRKLDRRIESEKKVGCGVWKTTHKNVLKTRLSHRGVILHRVQNKALFSSPKLSPSFCFGTLLYQRLSQRTRITLEQRLRSHSMFNNFFIKLKLGKILLLIYLYRSNYQSSKESLKN
jgi:hypothetical protein